MQNGSMTTQQTGSTPYTNDSRNINQKTMTQKFAHEAVIYSTMTLDALACYPY